MKLSKQIVLIIILIIGLTLFLVNKYTKKTNELVTKVMSQKLEKFTNSFLSNNISYDILNDANLDNILVINKNKDGEILYVDYNLDRAYEALEIITDVIYEDINNLELGMYHDITDKDIKASSNGLVLSFPFFIFSNSPVFSTLGPKIYAKVDFVGSVLTNVKSKITNYGYNNALVELFVTLEINELITSPVSKDEITVSYDVLVASKVINGRVPMFYDGIIDNKSANLDIPIT